MALIWPNSQGENFKEFLMKLPNTGFAVYSTLNPVYLFSKDPNGFFPSITEKRTVSGITVV